MRISVKEREEKFALLSSSFTLRHCGAFANRRYAFNIRYLPLSCSYAMLI